MKISTGYFDSDFFLYREDAELAWRLRNLGWKCLYVPQAVAYHRRHNLPERRALIRRHCPHRAIVAVVVRPSFTTPKAFLRDVAGGGVGLLVNAPIEPGAVLALQPPHLRPGAPRTVLAKVVHSSPEPTGDRHIGCILSEPLNEDELEACLLPP